MDCVCDCAYRSTAVAELFGSEDKSALVDVIKQGNCIGLHTMNSSVLIYSHPEVPEFLKEACLWSGFHLTIFSFLILSFHVSC
jgi:hypothetical protein